MKYNTGSWARGVVEWTDKRVAYLSVVFSWDIDDAYARAVWFRQLGYQVKVGGPGVFVRKKELAEIAEIGGAWPDAIVHHNPMATVASRGCPVGCWFCIVPAMEGRDFTLLPDFTVRPVLCDNNLSALPADFQQHIVDRYRATGVPLLDANSGFEPRTFDPDVYERWRHINRGPWRFAYDDQGDRPHVKRVLAMLADVSPNRKRVYVLIGNEPVAACLERINEVIAWGGQPHAQPYIKLNAAKKTPHIRFDWTRQGLVDMARWSNWRVWKYCTFEDYRSSKRTRRAPHTDQLEFLPGPATQERNQT